MKIFFMLNPSRRRHKWSWREIASRYARRAGWTPRFGEVDRSVADSMESLLGQALEEGSSRIVVVGGDGSMHRAVNILAKRGRLRDTELAIVPAGTCNDFARYLGLQRSRLEQAFRSACSAKARPVDLGAMDGELFLNNAGLGRRPLDVSSRSLQTSAPVERRRWKSVQALLGFRPTPLRARWEKGMVEGSFYMVLVCNAPYFSGGLHFSRSVNLKDELLDVYLMPAIPKWKLLPVLALGRLGRPTRFKRLITLRVPQLEIEAAADIWPQADGEPPSGAVRRVRFAVASEKAMIVSA